MKSPAVMNGKTGATCRVAPSRSEKAIMLSAGHAVARDRSCHARERAGHMLFADRKSAPLEAGAVRKMVTTVLAGVVREPQTVDRRGSKPLDTRR